MYVDLCIVWAERQRESEREREREGERDTERERESERERERESGRERERDSEFVRETTVQCSLHKPTDVCTALWFSALSSRNTPPARGLVGLYKGLVAGLHMFCNFCADPSSEPDVSFEICCKL